MKAFTLLTLLLLSACETGREVVIEAPIEAVWEYVGDSRNAAEWSVYFDHITPLPGGPDGGVGALRRCYRHADETGNRWDEVVVELQPQTYRQIRTYGLHGFPPEFGQPEFRVHQRFTKLGPNRTRLEFASELIKPRDPISLARFVTKVGEGNRVIGLNLENIKAAVEARHRGQPYQRPHPWEPQHPWDN